MSPLECLVRESRAAAAARAGGSPAELQAAIDARWAACASPAKLVRDYSAWQDKGDDRARLRFGFRFGTALRLAARAADEAKSPPGADNGVIAFRDQLRSEIDPAARRDLQKALCDAAQCAKSAQERRLEADRLARHVSGHSYVTLMCAQLGLDRVAMMQSATRFLKQTRSAYLTARQIWWGVGPQEPLDSADVAYLLRAGTAGGWTEQRFDLGAVAAKVIDLVYAGERPKSRFSLDIEHRPGKFSRAYAAPIDPPGQIVVAVLPTGSIRDIAELLHEIGHGLAFAGIDPNLPWEYRFMWDDPVQETFAFLISALLRQPSFASELLGVSASDGQHIADYSRFCEFHLMRHHAALALIALNGSDAEDGFPARCSDMLAQLTSTIQPSALAYEQMEPELGSASYLAAWIASAKQLERFSAEWGANWWQKPQPWQTMRQLWRTGGSAQQDAQIVTGQAPDYQALVAQALSRQAGTSSVAQRPSRAPALSASGRE